MKLIFAGTPDFAVLSLRKLYNNNQIEIKAVITQPDRKRGRGKRVQYSPVKKEALKLELEVMQPQNIHEDDFIRKIEKMDIDLIVVVAYGQILSKKLLNMPHYGCINLHASLLPLYRGSSPIQQAIKDGRNKTGVATMFMDEGLDTGDIIYQKEVEIKENYNAGDLHDRLAQIGAELLDKTLTDLSQNKVTRFKQNESKASYTTKLSKEDGLINWEKTNQKLYYFVKAMNPWPGSFTYLNGQLLKIFEAEPVKGNTDKKPGSIVEADPKKGLIVQTGRGLLKLNKLQLAGRKKMSSSDFLRGNKIEQDVKFEDKE